MLNSRHRSIISLHNNRWDWNCYHGYIDIEFTLEIRRNYCNKNFSRDFSLWCSLPWMYKDSPFRNCVLNNSSSMILAEWRVILYFLTWCVKFHHNYHNYTQLFRYICTLWKLTVETNPLKLDEYSHGFLQWFILIPICRLGACGPIQE